MMITQAGRPAPAKLKLAQHAHLVPVVADFAAAVTFNPDTIPAPIPAVAEKSNEPASPSMPTFAARLAFGERPRTWQARAGAWSRLL